MLQQARKNASKWSFCIKTNNITTLKNHINRVQSIPVITLLLQEARKHLVRSPCFPTHQLIYFLASVYYYYYLLLLLLLLLLLCACISPIRWPYSPKRQATILVTNLETLVWFFPSPMLIWVLQSSHWSKIRVAQHWGRRGANLSENEDVRSEYKKSGENSRQMAPVSTNCDEYCI